MRKIQEFLRAHCYDIAAYFISTTGLLFPRQAIADDAKNFKTTASTVLVGANHFITKPSSLISATAPAVMNGLAFAGTPGCNHIFAAKELMARRKDESIVEQVSGATCDDSRSSNQHFQME